MVSKMWWVVSRWTEISSKQDQLTNSDWFRNNLDGFQIYHTLPNLVTTSLYFEGRNSLHSNLTKVRYFLNAKMVDIFNFCLYLFSSFPHNFIVRRFLLDSFLSTWRLQPSTILWRTGHSRWVNQPILMRTVSGHMNIIIHVSAAEILVRYESDLTRA